MSVQAFWSWHVLAWISALDERCSCNQWSDVNEGLPRVAAKSDIYFHADVVNLKTEFGKYASIDSMGWDWDTI